MEADDNFDRARPLVELDGILHDVEQDLLVDLPVSMHPGGDGVAFTYLNTDVALVNLSRERLQEGRNHLADCFSGLGKVNFQLVHVNFSLSHLRCDQKREKAGRRPNDS
jgi:hypothetical protein